MYVIIVGAGKVGWNLARELIQKENEITLIESDPARYAVVEEELEHSVQYGDGSELWVLERAGIERADLVITVPGSCRPATRSCRRVTRCSSCSMSASRPG